MIVQNNNGYLALDTAVQVGPTPNRKGKIKSLEYIVNHYTAGGYPHDSSVSSMLDPNSKRSAHLFIDYNGTVHQLASLDDRLWHAGESSWHGRNYLNGYSIGIEFANPGLLSFKDGVYITYYGTVIPDHLVKEGPVPNSNQSGFWCKYTPEQITSGREVHAALIKYFPTIRGVVGHSDISPGRKVDPGPLFPMAEYRMLLKNNDVQTQPIESTDDNDDESCSPIQLKTSTNVNLRLLPSTSSNILVTIPNGSVISGTSTNDGWYAVSYTLKSGKVESGYVFAKYVTKIE